MERKAETKGGEQVARELTSEVYVEMEEEEEWSF